MMTMLRDGRHHGTARKQNQSCKCHASMFFWCNCGVYRLAWHTCKPCGITGLNIRDCIRNTFRLALVLVKFNSEGGFGLLIVDCVMTFYFIYIWRDISIGIMQHWHSRCAEAFLSLCKVFQCLNQTYAKKETSAAFHWPLCLDFKCTLIL